MSALWTRTQTEPGPNADYWPGLAALILRFDARTGVPPSCRCCVGFSAVWLSARSCSVAFGVVLPLALLWVSVVVLEWLWVGLVAAGMALGGFVPLREGVLFTGGGNVHLRPGKTPGEP